MNHLYAFITATIPAFILFSCTQPSYKIVDLEPKEEEKIIARGDVIATSLIQTLKTEVKQAIDNQGVEEAISVCNIKAIPLTTQVEELTGEPVSIKRTSFKYRNPGNEPDEIEAQALSYFEMLSSQGKEIPSSYTRKVITGSDTTYYYYKPMRMESLCLLCHGNETTIAPEVRGILSALYLNDLATGYEEGDFRGLIRIKWDHLN